jgi:hypothetical protein
MRACRGRRRTILTRPRRMRTQAQRQQNKQRPMSECVHGSLSSADQALAPSSSAIARRQVRRRWPWYGPTAEQALPSTSSSGSYLEPHHTVPNTAVAGQRDSFSPFRCRLRVDRCTGSPPAPCPVRQPVAVLPKGSRPFPPIFFGNGQTRPVSISFRWMSTCDSACRSSRRQERARSAGSTCLFVSLIF